jgi:hypothetical protein
LWGRYLTSSILRPGLHVRATLVYVANGWLPHGQSCVTIHAN